LTYREERLDSAVDSGKLHFRLQKVPPQRRKPDCHQHIEPNLAVPADSGNRGPFAALGSVPAVEFNGMFRAC
jgi:hypothetical protein